MYTLQFRLGLVGWSKIMTATCSGNYWVGAVATIQGGGVRNKDHLPSLPFADEVVVGPNPETGKVFSS